MVALRARMRERYADWQVDLPEDLVGADGEVVSGWRTFFADCPDLDWATIPEDLEIAGDASVWPKRRGNPPQGAPEGAHVCRAFDDIGPANVRVVVLGQDPYPAIGQATGRAFEDGAWQAEGRPEELADSLKRQMLAAWATRNGEAGLFRSGGWPVLIRRPGFALPTPRTHFDALVQQGVLFLNATWTRTRQEDLGVHMRLWRPVITYLLRKLSQMEQPTVFLLLGKEAQKAFCAIDPICNRSAIVCNAHPGRGGFFGRGNPLERVNQALGALGAPQSIAWWPHQQALPGEPA